MGALVEHTTMWGAMKHKGQVRKYTGEPYFTHCEAVAELVKEHFENVLNTPVREETYAAALLHDTVEDTNATIEEIEEIFGETVARYVWYLTKPPAFVGNRARRKSVYNAYLAQAPEDVKIIKFFDMMHNSTSIEEHDPKFWETFRRETIRMLIALDMPWMYKDYPEFVYRLRD